MEEKITKENFEQMLKEMKDSIFNEKIASENFSDEQKGMIKCWMDEAYALGVRNGEAKGTIRGISDKNFERYTDLMSGMCGDVNVDKIKRLLLNERYISSLRDNQVATLLSIIDKENFSVSMGLTCL